jgi:hypothetical protein
MGILEMIRQVFREERPLQECWNGMFHSGQIEKSKQVKSEVKSMLIISLEIKGIVHKEFVLAGWPKSQFCILL